MQDTTTTVQHDGRLHLYHTTLHPHRPRNWIVANATVLRFDPLPWPLLLALASVPQLPLMIVIMVGQGLLGRKQELQSEEQFNTTQKIYHDIEQAMLHLAAQDEELLRQTGMLVRLLEAAGLHPDPMPHDRHEPEPQAAPAPGG